MITGKLLGLLAGVIVVCIAVSALVGWGVASATLAASHSKTVAGATGANGSNGKDGSSGKDGANGVDGQAGPAGNDGTNGATGAKGATGATGAKGADGATGTSGAAGAPGTPGTPGPVGQQGDVGPAGPSGASAPSFALTSASGTGMMLGIAQAYGAPIGLPDAEIPAGPALIGFTVTIADPGGDFATCSLIDFNTNQTIASAAPMLLSLSPTTVSMTQVVTLAAPSMLRLECTPMFSLSATTYTGLSVYAISFASS